MSGEGIARLFVGIGFLWMLLVLAVGLVGGFDKPTTWFRLLSEDWEPGAVRYGYLALTLFIVPVGMLTYLRDVLGDPVALWVKMAAPGAFVAVYALFLLAALPDVGRPFFLAFDSLAPVGGLSRSLEATESWLIRFGVAFLALAGVPGFLGVVLSVVSRTGSRPRRR